MDDRLRLEHEQVFYTSIDELLQVSSFETTADGNFDSSGVCHNCVSGVQGAEVELNYLRVNEALTLTPQLLGYLDAEVNKEYFAAADPRNEYGCLMSRASEEMVMLRMG